MINEKDIFNSVFFPHLVDDEKKNLILNSENFKGIINFYKEIKSEANKPLSNQEKQNLSSKIPLYNYTRIYCLKRVDSIKKKRKSESLRLAAASQDEKPALTAISFIDDNERFLCRVIQTEKNTKIYSFSIKEDEIKNFKLTLLPSYKEFLIKDNSEPLDINELLDFEEIHIELM